jgi:glucosamine-6-phosphate deaminase
MNEVLSVEPRFSFVFFAIPTSFALAKVILSIKIKLGLIIMRITILHDEKEIGTRVAEIFVHLLQNKPQAILGFATGSSPLPVYAELIKDYREGRVSFREATSFNLDEYLACPDKKQTYRYFMDSNLFSQIDIRKSSTHFPSAKNPESYDEAIQKAGGVDLQLLGIGRDGHIGFNEPGAAFDSKTHIVSLAPSTIEANARFFNGDKSKVPTQAVTMGLGTILQAKQIILIADDPSKKEAISKLMSHQEDLAWPATVLNRHPNVDIFITESVLH